jgi:hypothetical protein
MSPARLRWPTPIYGVHFSTLLIAIALVTIWLLVVIPAEVSEYGSIPEWLEDGVRVTNERVPLVERGWPWVYLSEPFDPNPQLEWWSEVHAESAPWLSSDSWTGFASAASAHPAPLTADILLLVVLVGTACAVWNNFRSGPRALQFSIRGALLAMACVALPAGASINERLHCLREFALTGEYDSVNFGDGRPVWLRKLVGEKLRRAVAGSGFAHVRSIACYDANGNLGLLEPTELQCLGDFTELEQCSIAIANGVTAADFGPLSQLKRLAALGVATPINGKSLAQLCRLSQLRQLRIAGDLLADNDLHPLASLPRLEQVNVPRLDADQRNPDSPGGITREGLRFLLSLPNLKSLDLRGAKLDESCLELLLINPRLEHIDLSDTNVDGRAAQSFVDQHPPWLCARRAEVDSPLGLARGANYKWIRYPLVLFKQEPEIDDLQMAEPAMDEGEVDAHNKKEFEDK